MLKKIKELFKKFGDKKAEAVIDKKETKTEKEIAALLDKVRVLKKPSRSKSAKRRDRETKRIRRINSHQKRSQHVAKGNMS